MGLCQHEIIIIYLYFATVDPSAWAIGIGHLVNGIGKKRRIPVTLKKKWHRAIWRDLSKLSLTVKAAKREVPQVPRIKKKKMF